MKKLNIAIIFILIVVFATPNSINIKAFSAVNATAIIEAEDMVISKDAEIIENPAASSGKAVKILAAANNNTPEGLLNPTLSADVTLESASVYSLWARVIAPNSESNEIFYSHTGNATYNNIALKSAAGFVWVKVFETTAINGVFSINFKYKESGVVIDKLVFTADSDFFPDEMDSLPLENKINRIYPLPSVTPISGHPRLFASADIVDKLYENSQSDELIKMYNSVSALANEEPIFSILDDKMSAGTNFNSSLTKTLQSRAYMRLLKQVDSEHAKRTIKYMKELLATVKWNVSYQDVTRKMGDVMLTGAIIYDWCYDEMTSADKEFFIAHFKKLAFTKEIGYPPTKKYAFAGHGAEREIMCDLLAAGVACYDEDTEIYDLAAGRFFEEYIGSRIVFNKTGSHPVGSAYGHVRYAWELCAATIFDRMGYKNIMSEEISSVAYRYLYQRLPHGLWIKDNDDYSYGMNKYFSYNSNDALCYLLSSSLSGDSYLKGEWLKHFSINNYLYSSQDFYLWALLFSEPDIEMEIPEALPLTYKMTYPLTALTARTSWQMGLDANTSVIHMKAEEKVVADTSFADLGNFMIYYKGNLLINGGSYGGNNGDWGSLHAVNYAKRTISKNCLTVYDPEEKFTEFHGTTPNPPLANDGGQLVFAPRIEDYEDYLKVEDSARTDGLYIGPDEYTPVFSYVKTDLTNAYSDKISEYSRSMVAINFFDDTYPQGFICFDNVKTKSADLRKTWNLQTINAPVIEGNKTTITREDNGFGGKLVNRTLLPQSDNMELTRVGEGDGVAVTYVDGKNYSNPDINGYNTEQGNWRVELSPKNESQTDLFLNAMYVTDADNENELSAVYEESEEFCGVTLKNATVFFAKSYNTKQTENFELTIRDNGYEEVFVLVTDVASGKWKITSADIVTEVSDNENALCVKLTPGTYTFEVADGTATLNEQQFESMARKMIGDFHIYDTRNKLFMYQENSTKLIDNKTYVPLRNIFEELGATVSWDGENATVSKNKVAIITPGSVYSTIGGVSKKLTYEPINISGVIYVYPMDFNSFLGVTFKYDTVAKILKIS